MANRDTAELPREPDVSPRLERAHRILDAAGELVLRWGYDKTTIDDVARAAGVAKGTIYLHWNTREALFVALLRRERASMLAEVRRDVAGDPGGATLRGLVRHVGLALMRRPMMKAVFLGNAEVLGKLIRQKPSSETIAELRPRFERYLGTLRRHGAIRADLSFPEQINVIIGAVYGFFLAAPLMPHDYKLPDEHLADLLADTVQRALESGREVWSSDETETISRATLEYLDFVAGVAQDKLRQSLDASGKERTP